MSGNKTKLRSITTYMLTKYSQIVQLTHRPKFRTFPELFYVTCSFELIKVVARSTRCLYQKLVKPELAGDMRSLMLMESMCSKNWSKAKLVFMSEQNNLQRLNQE